MLQKTTQTLDRLSFIAKADGISDNPLDRIPATIHPLLDPSLPHKDDEVFIDVHAHSFTLSNVPANFIRGLRFLSNTYKKKIIGWLKKKLAKYLGQEGAITVIKQLFTNYQEHFVSTGLSPKIFVVNLMMDMERGIKGDLTKRYIEQLTELAEIRKNKSWRNSKTNITTNFEEQLLPFLAVDPHNPDVYKQFLSVFDPAQNETDSKKLDDIMSFVGVKLYPPLGYLPSDPILMDIFEICEKKNIPIMTHIGGYRTMTEFDKVQLGNRKYNPDGTFVDEYKEYTINDNIEIKSLLIQPMQWKTVLDRFPKLKVCFAHMGDKPEWTNYRKNPDDFRNHVRQTLELIKDPKYNVYADISYSFTVKANVKLIKKLLDDPAINKKILFGSDFYLTEVEKMGSVKSFTHLYEELAKDKDKWKRLTYTNTCQYLFGK